MRMRQRDKKKKKKKKKKKMANYFYLPIHHNTICFIYKISCRNEMQEIVWLYCVRNVYKHNYNYLIRRKAGNCLTLILLNPDMSCFANSVEPDQLTSEEGLINGLYMKGIPPIKQQS